MLPEKPNLTCVTDTGAWSYEQCQVDQVWEPSCGSIRQFENADCTGQMLREWRMNIPWQRVYLWDPVWGAKVCGS